MQIYVNRNTTMYYKAFKTSSKYSEKLSGKPSNRKNVNSEDIFYFGSYLEKKKKSTTGQFFKN